ncbi:YggT family protein [Kangiella sp. TOML190]|uniref:YggT family protein n=1 Tax=Kangiella sp. TOML190 TaxID=2931351 RepID=UPI00203C3408|nr:YggT family protein [Kangiella sp. TOML190]
MNVFIQIIEHLGNLLCMIFLVRILLQLARADFNNPLAQLIHKFTYPILNPLRSLIPDLGKFNLTALIIALVILTLKFFVISSMLGQPLSAKYYLVTVLLGFPAFAGLLVNIITLLTVLFIGLMLASFLSGGQYNPAYAFLHQVTNPVLQPLRKIIPPIGGAIDITPMIVLLVLIYSQSFLVNLAAKFLA